VLVSLEPESGAMAASECVRSELPDGSRGCSSPPFPTSFVECSALAAREVLGALLEFEVDELVDDRAAVALAHDDERQAEIVAPPHFDDFTRIR